MSAVEEPPAAEDVVPAPQAFIREDLKVLRVDAASVHPNPWNPNRQDDRTYTAERESIRTFGFLDPCLVWPHPEKDEGQWQIIDGEHRWKAAQDEGLTEILVTPVYGLSEAQAKKLTIILNETRGEADVVLLGTLLADLKAADEANFAIALPYSTGELDHLLSLAAEDWDRFAQGDEAPPEPEAAPDTHDVLLTFTTDEYERFNTHVGILRKEQGLDSVPHVILAAVAAAALAANQG